MYSTVRDIEVSGQRFKGEKRKEISHHSRLEIRWSQRERKRESVWVRQAWLVLLSFFLSVHVQTPTKDSTGQPGSV
jgi:hypothetical protein